ncbi:hypothetical protein ACUV84_029178 [Puccinellia chinampoensis]
MQAGLHPVQGLRSKGKRPPFLPKSLESGQIPASRNLIRPGMGAWRRRLAGRGGGARGEPDGAAGQAKQGATAEHARAGRGKHGQRRVKRRGLAAAEHVQGAAAEHA